MYRSQTLLRNIKLRTAVKEFSFDVPESLTLEEFLRAKRFPPSLFQGYIVQNQTEKPTPLNIQISNISKESEIILQCVRNSDLRDILPQKLLYSKVDNPITAISDLSLGKKECTEVIYEIDTESAKQIVHDKTYDFIQTSSESSTIIVGISGGGDSNTLVRSLTSFSEKKFTFFTIVLYPLWPSTAADRAAELCRENNVQHHIYDNKAIEELFEMKKGLGECYKEYCKEFGIDTSHFFGTYLISLLARKLCKKYRSKEYILGFNREDLLAEMLYSLMNGQKPLEFPIRHFGDIKLLMPLWEIPKKILDACYPKYSLSNYQEREMDDSGTFQRSLIYYLAHGVGDVYPNLGLTLMKGARKMFQSSWPIFEQKKNPDLFVSEYASASAISKMETFLNKYF
jgi:tRNA(Ile)-lysidine synthase TilS/MesJ